MKGPFFIGIAGGSGSGKTTLAVKLKSYFGKNAAVFHLDNYQKFGKKLPILHGLKNWDRPNSVDWKQLRHDLEALKKGKSVTLILRDQKSLKVLRRVILKPKKVLIVEGYLLFLKASIRRLFETRIFLDASDKMRMKRRTKFKDDEYIRRVLLPMHRKYIEPTKKTADLVINTERLSPKKILRFAISTLKEKTNHSTARH
ncbi:MAG: hypothetical protein A3C11_02950 [Candidatus Sungbacteria bacterium RIFCSPHIGHO2_02_FULL_49_12]|uniref:Phosphoribulokinase/uridine kinase domain-containing protein n=1 Tax=Candidatus Sungbacteria bacterium RIFCSPHIGHO2_02_FULL_49_12 TaxID=1802271 RepID=A0A1G2KMC7_9BACT|nr:MAG: hypothetical protein A3C11_02950 [Candidatus Sungbacteria bacterium RIFCSPHIGHO2_02_FULL_49_12]